MFTKQDYKKMLIAGEEAFARTTLFTILWTIIILFPLGLIFDSMSTLLLVGIPMYFNIKYCEEYYKILALSE